MCLVVRSRDGRRHWQTWTATTLAPAYEHAEALSTLLGEVAAEKVMEIAAEKESNYVVSDRRLA